MSYNESAQPIEPALDRWFALRVRSNFEKPVATMLRGNGYTEFLPLYLKTSRWSDRVKQIELPLFPGYVFARFDVTKRLPILKMPGVLHVVGVGRTPQPLEESELAAVQRVVASGLPVKPWPFLRTGQLVKVQLGALTGLEGIVLDIKSTVRLIISLTLMQRSVAVEIDREWVKPVASSLMAPTASA